MAYRGIGAQVVHLSGGVFGGAEVVAAEEEEVAGLGGRGDHVRHEVREGLGRGVAEAADEARVPQEGRGDVVEGRAVQARVLQTLRLTQRAAAVRGGQRDHRAVARILRVEAQHAKGVSQIAGCTSQTHDRARTAI